MPPMPPMQMQMQPSHLPQADPGQPMYGAPKFASTPLPTYDAMRGMLQGAINYRPIPGDYYGAPPGGVPMPPQPSGMPGAPGGGGSEVYYAHTMLGQPQPMYQQPGGPADGMYNDARSGHGSGGEYEYTSNPESASDNEGMYICPEPTCMRPYSRINALRNHLKDHPERTYHLCMHCGRAYGTALELDQHSNVHTPQELRARRKPSKRSPRLVKAQRVAPIEENGYFVCDEPDCGKKYKRIEHLKRHKIEHTGIKPWACNYPNCTKSFTRADNLQQHMNTHMRALRRRQQAMQLAQDRGASGRAGAPASGDKRPWNCTYAGCNAEFIFPDEADDAREHFNGHLQGRAQSDIDGAGM
eukprot:Unigene7633_Nuclearia_a/m.23461 Unigene7633_Nuclearia_a/g.23461  ORF Unigene7633_Nuclearia_a/g.23461 Unigene7633_Nuclearia_a/m.23461 type:complete len:356 (+) Unigene7633_Nuclearia_a:3-1070(+)